MFYADTHENMSLLLTNSYSPYISGKVITSHPPHCRYYG